jgi:hypothetical protein
MLGRIYKLECNDGYYYIGSTIQTLEKRIALHKFYSKIRTTKVYNYINKINWDNVKIVLIKEVEVFSLKELHIEENIYINLNNILCLNERLAYISDEDKKEYKKKWCEDNKEKRQLMRKKNDAKYYLKKNSVKIL